MLLLAEFATETIFQLRLRSNSNPMRASDFRQSLDGLEWSRMSSWKNVYVQWICKKRGQLFAILSLLRSNFHEEPYRNVVLLYFIHIGNTDKRSVMSCFRMTSNLLRDHLLVFPISVLKRAPLKLNSKVFNAKYFGLYRTHYHIGINNLRAVCCYIHWYSPLNHVSASMQIFRLNWENLFRLFYIAHRNKNK